MRHKRPLNDLWEIMTALQSYLVQHRHFPPQAIYDRYDRDKRPLLSWRVAILAELGCPAMEFNFDEPWDSKHNEKFIEQMPEIYRPVPTHTLHKTPVGMTRYQAVVGKNCAFEGSEGMNIRSIPDGTANTIMLVETDHDAAVPWTKPVDWMFDEMDPLKSLWGSPAEPLRETFAAAFVDGHVEDISRRIDPEAFKCLVLRNDGKPIHRYPISPHPI
jgi:hypothetical protein